MTMLSSRIPETEYESICNLLLNQRQSASECSHVRAHKVQDCGDTSGKVRTGAGLIFTFKKSLPSDCMSAALHRAWPGDGRRGYTHNQQGDKLFCVGFRPKCRKAKTPFTFKFSAFTWEFKKITVSFCTLKSLSCSYRVECEFPPAPTCNRWAGRDAKLSVCTWLFHADLKALSAT